MSGRKKEGSGSVSGNSVHHSHSDSDSGGVGDSSEWAAPASSSSAGGSGGSRGSVSSVNRGGPSVLSTVHNLSYDAALEIIGINNYHVWLLALCGWANASDATEIMAASFILPSAGDDLDLSDSDKGWLGGVIFAGMMIGGYIWGALADVYGRKVCLLAALLVNVLGGVLCGVAPSFAFILLFRLIAGIGVGGSVPVLFTLAAEFFTSRYRGQFMVLAACFWMLGATLNVGLAWAILPLKLSLDFFGTPVHGWRIYTFLCTVPSVICCIILLFGLESPRFLLIQGRRAEAITVLCKIYRRSVKQRQRQSPQSPTSSSSAANSARVHWLERILSLNLFYESERMTYTADDEAGLTALPLDEQEYETLLKERLGNRLIPNNAESPSYSSSSSPSSSEADGSSSFLSNNNIQSPHTSPEYSSVPVLLDDGASEKVHLTDKDNDSAAATANPSVPNVQALTHGEIAERDDVPTLSSQFALMGRQTLSLFHRPLLKDSLKLTAVWFALAFGYYGITTWIPSYFSARSDSDDDSSTNDPDTNTNTYLAPLLSSVANLPGNVISVWSVRRFGRQRTLLVSLVLSSLCLFFVTLPLSDGGALALICIFGGVSVGAWNALNIVTTELYVTSIRSTAFGVFAALGRVGAVAGNLLFGAFISLNISIPIFVSASAFALAAIATFFTPETKDRNIA